MTTTFRERTPGELAHSPAGPARARASAEPTRAPAGLSRIPAERERGSAAIEFVSIGVLLMVPLVYFVIAMSRVQAASFAADGSAREAARAFVTAADDDDGYRRAAIAVQLGLHDQGFDEGRDGSLTVDCASPTCLTPGSQVIVRVEVRVLLPGIPRFIGQALDTSVTVRASQTAAVDQFRQPGTTS